MPAPDLQFYATSIHNFAASTIILAELQHAVERARNGEVIPGAVILQAGDALSTVVDAARAMLADVVVAGTVTYDDLAAEVANVLASGVAQQHCEGSYALLVEAVAHEVAALERHLAKQKEDTVLDVTEAKEVLARIAKRGA